MCTALKKILGAVGYLLIVLTLGLVGSLAVYAAIACGQLRVRGWWRLIKPRRGGTLIVANHPSIQETEVLPLLFVLPSLLLGMPWRVPWSTPDARNFFNQRKWAWARVRMIPIPRGNNRETLLATIKMVQLLSHGASIILFPEGGRTSSGKNHRYSRSGRIIREFRPTGVGRLISEVGGVRIIPLWVERAPDTRAQINGRAGWWRRMTIVVGQPLVFVHEVDRKTVARTLELRILELADQVNA